MTATEVLRRLLDERGVEWWQSVNMLGCVFTRWYSPLFSDEVVAMENGDGELELFSHLMTPEQVIAATLVAGTLTAEQVMAIAGRHQPDYCSDTHACFDWQAIADELNDTLGSCNCPDNCTNGERTETCADGGTVSETYIRPTEEGSICPIPRASVIFEGQKLTFDAEDSARFTEIVKRHLRKLAGLEVEQ